MKRGRTSRLRSLGILAWNVLPRQIPGRNTPPGKFTSRCLHRRNRRRYLLIECFDLLPRSRGRPDTPRRPMLNRRVTRHQPQSNSHAGPKPADTSGNSPCPPPTCPVSSRRGRRTPSPCSLARHEACNLVRFIRSSCSIGLQNRVRLINLLKPVLCLFPQPGIAPKSIRMPHLHQVAISLFDLNRARARPQRQNRECFIR